MWAAGLIGEVEQLTAVGLRDGVTARRALGYAQVLRVLDGELSEDQARLMTQQATRRFVRRQRSWFRRERRIDWLPARGPGSWSAQSRPCSHLGLRRDAVSEGARHGERFHLVA